MNTDSIGKCVGAALIGFSLTPEPIYYVLGIAGIVVLLTASRWD